MTANNAFAKLQTIREKIKCVSHDRTDNRELLEECDAIGQHFAGKPYSKMTAKILIEASQLARTLGA